MLEIFTSFFVFLGNVDRFFWTYIGFVILFASGIFLTIYSKGFQFRVLGNLSQCFKDILRPVDKSQSSRGIHPLRLYFSSVSGMVGLGNVVGIVTALVIGGPGSLFWMWIAAFPSMIVKYAEVYLGIRYRVPNAQSSYDGGPMFYLQKAFKKSCIPVVSSVLLCIYGVEVFQFTVVSDVLARTFHVDKILVILVLLTATLYAVLGGVRRLSRLCSFCMPIFLILYIGMCLIVIFQHLDRIPEIIHTVFYSAFSGQAATGAFIGSGALLAIQQGISRAVYSGDIGIGYDSIIQAETRALLPQNQARLSIFSLLTDTFICSLSMFVVLLTDVWTLPLDPDQFVGHALVSQFQHADLFMALFLFLAGFTTIIAYLTVGVKCAFFLKGHFGKILYLLYAAFAFIFFSFFDQKKALLVMSVSSGFLILFNLCGILKLRHFIKFK